MTKLKIKKKWKILKYILIFICLCYHVEGFLPSKINDKSILRSIKEKKSNTELMGIKGFRSWFESTFPNAMTPIVTEFHPPISNNKNSNKKNIYHTDTFEHVLIDVNQLLHVALRRARNEGHALTMVLKELDKCLYLAQPTKSVVLALDGPPSAAKLATQRRRRYGTVIRSALKRERQKVFAQRLQNQTMDDSLDSNVTNPIYTTFMNKRRNQRQNRLNEEATLCITPGTEFMDKAADAILYWTWQRMTNPSSQLRMNKRNVKVYLSTSDAPGEGEVKLLDWVFQLGCSTRLSRTQRTRKHQQVVKPGDSIAIMGGDSDLVLEGLILPPSITHNVFVILPDGNKKSYSVSLWETTRALLQFLPNHHYENRNTNDTLQSSITNQTIFSEEDFIMSVRTDLVLLLIMNGNDYLPKLRGSSGFNKLFHTYLKILKQWLDSDRKSKNSKSKKTFKPLGKPFLINLQKLSFNIPFCLAFFRELAKTAPKLIDSPADMLPYQKSLKASVTPLSSLNTMMDSGFIPKPAEWKVIRPQTNKKKSYQDNVIYMDFMDIDDGNNVTTPNEKHEIVQLTLGDPNSKITPYYVFEVNHRKRTQLKTTKHRLASMALDEILGSDWRDLNYYTLGNDLEDGDESMEDTFDDENDDDDDDDDDDGLDLSMFSSYGYSWEVQGPVNCNVEQYLAGILWNLQTYQDGVCADYAYNYGRRMSPTAAQIVEYLTDYMNNNNKDIQIQESIGRQELLGDNFTEALNAGLSCLAALPVQAKHLVPEPYNLLTADDIVEQIYEECMDSENNVFDIESFRNKSTLLIEKRMTNKNEKKHNVNKRDTETRGRKIRTSSRYWTVISPSNTKIEHPFAPPQPFTDRLRNLRLSNRIKVTRLWATDKPKWQTKTNYSMDQVSKSMLMIHGAKHLEYKIAYRDAKQEADRNKKKNVSKKLSRNIDRQSNLQKDDIGGKQKQKKFGTLTALSSLQCLIDTKCITGPIEWIIDENPPDSNGYGEETIKLDLGGFDGRSFEIKRQVNGKKRKEVKQILASNVLNELLGSDWQKMTVQQMRKSINSGKLK